VSIAFHQRLKTLEAKGEARESGLSSLVTRVLELSDIVQKQGERIIELENKYKALNARMGKKSA
jgi:hypothetical protein